MSEPVIMGHRATVEGVVCEIGITATADSCRGEMISALQQADREILQAIDRHFRFGAPVAGGEQRG